MRSIKKSEINGESFEILFKEYFNPIYNYINQFVNNREDSREITQNTFLKIWENKDQLAIHTSFKSYLYRVAKNAMIDYKRKHNRMNIVDFSEKEIELLEPEEEINEYLAIQELKNILQELKPKNREIFMLNKFEGLTYKEIAEYLQISERSVEDNISRAVKYINKRIDFNEFVN